MLEILLIWLLQVSNKNSPCLELNYMNKEVIYRYIFCRISSIRILSIYWILVTLTDKDFWKKYL